MDAENNPKTPLENKPESKSPAAKASELSQEHPAKQMLAGALVLGFLAGAAGGFFGTYYALKNPNVLNRTGSVGVGAQIIDVEEESATVDVVKKAGPAVVSIIISRDISKLPINPFDPFGGFFSVPRQSGPNIQQVGAGSGFFVTSDGMILTNKHVVPDETDSYTVITSDGAQYPATVLARDPINDVAIIKIDIQNAPTLEFADSSNIDLGSHVIAIGNSLGQYQNTVTTGVVSGIGRSITAGDSGTSEQLEGVIQTDAAINPGNSGGPLLNLAGQVIGINTAMDQQGQLVGFAIQSNDARRAVDSYKEFGRIVRPYLGIRYITITKAVAEQRQLSRDFGALVLAGENNEPAVIPGSPAQQAGIQEGDIILSINGKRVDKDNTILSLLKDVSPGDTISLAILRGDQEQTLNLKVGER